MNETVCGATTFYAICLSMIGILFSGQRPKNYTVLEAARERLISRLCESRSDRSAFDESGNNVRSIRVLTEAPSQGMTTASMVARGGKFKGFKGGFDKPLNSYENPYSLATYFFKIFTCCI